MKRHNPIKFMKRIIPSLLALSLPLLSFAPLSAALDTRIVSADAQWVLHLDLNALRESTLGKELVVQVTAFQATAMQGQKMPVQIDVPKFLETIGTITAYGTNLSQDPKLVDGALIFQGTADLRKIAEGAVAQATITIPDKVVQLKDLPFEAYSLDGQLIIAFPPEPIILISKSKTQLVAAQKIFRGEGASLARTKSSALTGLIRNQEGGFVTIASVVPSGDFFPDDAPQARILQMAKSAAVELGEKNKQTFAHVQLLASSDDTADKLMKILQGITAMISLAETSDKYLAEFLKSVSVAREKNTVTLHLAYSSERLLAMLNEVREEAQRNEKPKSAPSRPAPKVEGKVIETWTANQDLGANSVTFETMVSRTIADVNLSAGSLIILTGVRDAEEYARIDRVELTPVAGGQPLRFEAEHMNLRGYRVENNVAASGGKLVQAQGRGTAQFQFPGADGVYSLTVRYCDENDGKSSYTLSVKAPESVEAEGSP
jgi:hypothetical protein